ncbi:hypothetical protein KI387_011696, partial [Taxus chinensis]
MHKTHIPGFGNWDVANNNVVITEYFDIARAGREKREGNENGHIESHPKRGPSIPKISNKVDTHTDIRTEEKIRFAQRDGNYTVRQTDAVPSKPPKSFPAASRELRANSGQVWMHQAAINSSTVSQKLAVNDRVVAEIRPIKSAPLEPKETEVYQLKSGIKKETYQRGRRSRTEMGSSAWARKEPGGSRTPSPSIRPNNVRREFGGSRTPSPSVRPSNVRKEFGLRKSPSPSSIRPCNEKLSSNKNHKKKALPRFGEWDANDPAAGIAFTSIFNDARNDKKEAVTASRTSSQMDAATPIDEDLYKQPSSSHKKNG